VVGQQKGDIAQTNLIAEIKRRLISAEIPFPKLD
jgi:hypothetical protein